MHLHTRHSDGELSTAEVCRRAREAGLDFVVITDHNNTTHQLDAVDVPGLLRIVGEEVTTPGGHASVFGLGASIWTKDRAKGDRMSRRIESGMVWVNDHSFSHGACQCAWGGVKDSGLGRSHSKFGFYECVNVKQLAWEPGWTRDMWWQPYDKDLGTAISKSAQILYGRNGKRLDALRDGLGPLLRVTRKTLQKGK